jgi:hypothetical protein
LADTSAAGCCKGDYLQAFMIAGAAGIVAAVLSLMIDRPAARATPTRRGVRT